MAAEVRGVSRVDFAIGHTEQTMGPPLGLTDHAAVAEDEVFSGLDYIISYATEEGRGRQRENN